MKMSVRHQKWATLSQIPDNKLTTFIFFKKSPNTELKIINSREIEVNGNIYDVVRKEQNAKQTIYRCIHDKKEQNLIAKTRFFNSETHQSPIKNTARLIFEKIIKTALFETELKKHICSNILQNIIYPIHFYKSPPLADDIQPPKV